jgi:hypothetical protein
MSICVPGHPKKPRVSFLWRGMIYTNAIKNVRTFKTRVGNCKGSQRASGHFDCSTSEFEITTLDAKMVISVTPKHVFWVCR